MPRMPYVPGTARRHRGRLGLCLATAVLLATGATACGSSGGSGDGHSPDHGGGHSHEHDHGSNAIAEVPTSPGTKPAVVLDTPFEKPDLLLTDTRGKKYDLIKETEGRPTLLFFGYTNCPDVCPLTMSNIAVAKKQLPRADQDKLRVVFVTSDPERDTPEALGTWLRAQDPDFIGLTGDFDTIRAAARSVGVSLEPPVVKDNGDVVSTHGTQVLAFSPKDDKAHVLYTADVVVDTYTKDLPKLVKGEIP